MTLPKNESGVEPARPVASASKLVEQPDAMVGVIPGAMAAASAGAPPTITASATTSATALAEWSVRRIILGTLTVIGICLCFYLLYRFYMVVFLFFGAVALQVALEPVVNWLHGRGLHKGLSVILLYIVMFALFCALLWFIAPLLITQAREVLQDLPSYYAGLRDYLINSPIGLLRGIGRTLPVELSLPMILELSNGAAETATTTALEGTTVTTVTTTVTTDTGTGATAAAAAGATGNSSWLWIESLARTLFALIAIFALAFYWTLEGNVIVRRFILRTPTTRREELRTLSGEFTRKIGGYFRGQAILSVIVGVASALAFLLLGIPNALLLGLLMGIFEAIPIIGPTLGAIPAILLTLAAAPEKTLWVVGALVFIQVAENHLLVPKVMDQSVGVNAIVSILAIAAFGALFGLAGAILAIPLAAILQILLNRLLFNTPIGDDVAPPVAPAQGVSRSHIGVLRLEAQEVVRALQKQVQTETTDEVPDMATEQIEDRIEALATELDGLLAKMETPA